MTAAAMLVYPGLLQGRRLARSGNHENNIYNSRWSEKHHGVKEVDDKDGKVTFEYTSIRTGDREEPEGPPDADHRRHRQQRPPGEYVPHGRRPDQGEQAFRLCLCCPASATATRPDRILLLVRADYFCRWLLGKEADSVDIIELNREKEQTGSKKGPR